jgi:Tfp pilus assembly protein PilX
MFVPMRRDETGAALIVALGVTFVVLLLSTVIVNQAIHGSTQSAYDRRRLTSVNAAEAGLNYYFNYLETTGASTLSTSATTIKVGTSPNPAQATITPTFYSDAAGTVAFSGTPSSTNFPQSVKLVSVGTSNSQATRTMETFIKLTPVYSGVTGALIANSDTTFGNSFTVNGNSGNDGDVYVLNGNFSVPSGLETIKGSLWVSSGTATVGTQLHLYGEIWASGSVSVGHPQAQIDSNVKSTSGGVTVSSGTVSGGAWYCTGSAPSNVSGAKTQTCSLGPPPTQTFPQIKYVQSAWAALGYYEKVFTGATACTDARDWVEGTTAGTYQSGSGVPSGYTGAVVYINATCAYTNSNNSTVNLGTDLGIVTNGSINLSNHSTWNGVTSTRSLFFLSAYPASGSPSCPTQNITVGQNNDFNSLVQTGVYSPCTVAMNNNNTAFSGQVIGTTLTIGGNFNMTYRPVVIPGANIANFREDIAYIREIS